MGVRRLVAILGGGDWTDASVDHLTIPIELDLKQVLVEYKEWYSEWRLRNMSPWSPPPRPEEPYWSFTEWLKRFKGAQIAAETDIELFNEDD